MYLIEICNILDKDASEFEKLKAESEVAFKKEFFDESTVSFANGIQGADVFGYDLGLGNEKTLSNIIEKYNSLGHFDTGIFGTDVLCKVLANTKNYRLLFKLLSSEEIGSFGFMRKNGATTLWERWNGHESRNHPMFGSAAKYLIYEFAGIKFNEGKFTFEPHTVDRLDFVSAEENSDRGFAKISWKKENGKLTIDAESDKEAIFKFQNEETVFSGKISKTYNI